MTFQISLSNFAKVIPLSTASGNNPEVCGDVMSVYNVKSVQCWRRPKDLDLAFRVKLKDLLLEITKSCKLLHGRVYLNIQNLLY